MGWAAAGGGGGINAHGINVWTGGWMLNYCSPVALSLSHPPPPLSLPLSLSSSLAALSFLPLFVFFNSFRDQQAPN